MNRPNRERLIRRIARAILWADAQGFQRDAARRTAIGIVDDLFEAKAEGEAMRRVLVAIADAERDTA